MISIAESINWISEKFMNAPIISSALKNPFATALLIVVVVFCIYSLSGSDDSRDIMRGGFYSFLFVTLVLFLNNKFILDNKIGGGPLDDIETHKTPSEELIPVTINTNF